MSMSTNTEKYLKDNRHLLDVEHPDDDAIWSKIQERDIEAQQESQKKKVIFLVSRTFRRIAASVIILLALSYIAIDLTVGISIRNENYLSQLSTEYGNIEKDYIRTVKYKEQEVKDAGMADSDIIRAIISELKELDKLYSETEKDLIELGDNQQVVNTIFNIYERKIELLERIIVETNKNQNYEKNIESEI